MTGVDDSVVKDIVSLIGALPATALAPRNFLLGRLSHNGMVGLRMS
jgi:hypothetical protein